MTKVSALQNAIANLEKSSLTTRKKLLKHKAAKKFYTKSTLLAHELREKSTQLLAGAGLVGALLVSPVGSVIAKPATQITQADLQQSLANGLSPIVPHQPTKLTEDQAKQVEEKILNTLGIPAKAGLHRLRTTP